MNCLLVSPRFSDFSYWNYREVCEIFDARYPAAPLGLATVAALLPQTWDIRVLDLNVREMDETVLEWADLVLAGGMLPQQRNLRALIDLVHAHGKRIAVGGQDPTSQPDVLCGRRLSRAGRGRDDDPGLPGRPRGGRAAWDVPLGGEARCQPKPDPAVRSPRARQVSAHRRSVLAGLPLNCEFCDIIELYGRKPRTKTPDQVLRELECLYRLGYRGHVDFVDDNFIGNKKAVMGFLPELLAWSRERGFPFYFSTEASLNVADDPKLLAMMEAVDFRYLFMGIETADKALLIRTQKKQNTRNPIVESVHRVNAHGMVVTAGFILGFDGETPHAAGSIVECVEATGIAMAMVGLLTALPNTQLTRRLAREGRLPEDFALLGPGDVDQATTGLNFVPSRPRTEILAEYAAVLGRLYSPKSYFDRVRALASRLRRRPKQVGTTRGRRRELSALAIVTWRLGFARATARYFWRNVLLVLATRPGNFEAAMHLMALFIHFDRHTRFVLDGLERRRALGSVDPVALELGGA